MVLLAVHGITRPGQIKGMLYKDCSKRDAGSAILNTYSKTSPSIVIALMVQLKATVRPYDSKVTPVVSMNVGKTVK